MVFWQKFDPDEFEFEFDENELSGHGITVDEAVEVIWNVSMCAEINAIMEAIKSAAAPMVAVR